MTKVIDNGTKNVQTFTYDPAAGTIVARGPQAADPPSTVYIDPSGGTYTKAQIDASVAANPNASTGGVGPGVFTTDTTGPGGSGPGSLSGFDWQDYLGMFGLPTDVTNEINSIFSGNTDVTTATQLALAYIRGTDWYATTYPGIQQGIAKGVIQNEADYRNYLNQANQLYQNFYGRQISSNELGALLQNGVDISLLGKQLGASSQLASLNKLAVSGYFTQDELKQIANASAGLPSQTGDYLNGLLQYTQSLAPVYSQFGVPLSRDVLEQNYRNGVTVDTAGKQLQGNAYIAANRPEIQYLSGAFGDGQLSDQQLTSYGQQQAGLDTGLGEQLNTMINKAQARLNRIFQGSLGTPTLSLSQGGQLASPALGAAAKPDVAA